MHGLRPEYQERVNFVILDYDRTEDAELADRLGVLAHPAFAVVAPDSDEVSDRLYGPLGEEKLREVLDGVIAAGG